MFMRHTAFRRHIGCLNGEIMTRLLILFATISLFCLSVQPVLGASVTITPTAGGSYIVQGNSMDGVAGIELTITYDSSSLSSPTVTQGALVAGAMMVANTGNPGSIKTAIISTKTFSGSGEIATVTFATRNGTGGITSATVKMIDSKGVSIPAQATVSGESAPFENPSGFTTTAGVPFSQPVTAGVTTGSSSAVSSSSSSLPTQLGTVNMPSDAQAKSDPKPVDSVVVPIQNIEPPAVKPVDPPAEVKPVAAPQKQEAIKITSYKGVLESFRVFNGKKSPAAYSSLYNKEITPAIRQEPAVALSDGKTTLNILIKLDTADDKSPNFSLNGARLVSLSKDDSLRWTVVVLPKTGTVQASLTILTDSDMIEYPLTVAPPVEGVSAVEADFAAFLTDSGASPSTRDLNGDGRHDYLDDFIYTANYLRKKGVTDKTPK